MDVFERILEARGLTGESRDIFLNPRYETAHDPYLLPDMQQAVKRLALAKQANEAITIYGDYDIDGLTATTLLLDALTSFGFSNVNTFIPNRFVEGYGMTIDAIERIAATGATLIITVDCGSLSEKEIIRAKELGMDVIVTDHHNVAPVQPPAVAVINPKRLLADYPDEYDNFVLKKESVFQGKLYPFLDLPGVGVAFKLIQALQRELEGIPRGQEKWLLDLVALGTVCDVVTLRDENRMHVYWGLHVLKKTRRAGLRALMAVAKIQPQSITARHLGFGLGPRMNAAGRLETAQIALDMLVTENREQALDLANRLDEMNHLRRLEQDSILKQAIQQAETLKNDDVLVVSAPGWNHGIVGIVAAKLLERYKKPTFVLGEEGVVAKGSARSFGDFSAADAIRSVSDIITKGGGHKLAAGVTIPVEHIDAFRKRMNDFYHELHLTQQERYLLPNDDIITTFDTINEKIIELITTLEPFGNGNPQPVILTKKVTVTKQRRMGADAQHVKLELQDVSGKRLEVVAFNAQKHLFADVGTTVNVWYQPENNEWNGKRTIQGILLHLEVIAA
jgi:single-stranded-DNA-specific exonuclease